MNDLKQKKITPKVLITLPALDRAGGVSALYNILKLNEEKNIDYFEIHGSGKLSRIADLLLIYIKFIRKLPKYNIVQCNPSLTIKSFYRDAMFVFIARMFRKKVIVYWHGWEDDFAAKIYEKPYLKIVFKNTFAKADLTITLGTVFIKKLNRLGVTSNIVFESNAASTEHVQEEVAAKELTENKIVNLLFLSRIETEKGIYITLDAFNNISNNYSVKLCIAGDGSEIETVKNYVKENNIKPVEFLGFVEGIKKHQALNNSDLLILPSYHEGMPIVVLEAMLYGLPVISRPVGGIPDWIKEGENGNLIDSLNPAEFSKAILMLLNNKEKFKEISQNNIQKAQTHFVPEVVKARMHGYYKTLISKNEKRK